MKHIKHGDKLRNNDIVVSYSTLIGIPSACFQSFMGFEPAIVVWLMAVEIWSPWTAIEQICGILLNGR